MAKLSLRDETVIETVVGMFYMARIGTKVVLALATDTPETFTANIVKLEPKQANDILAALTDPTVVGKTVALLMATYARQYRELEIVISLKRRYSNKRSREIELLHTNIIADVECARSDIHPYIRFQNNDTLIKILIKRAFSTSNPTNS